MAGLRFWVAEVEQVLVRVLAGVRGRRRLAQATEAAFVGLELYEGSTRTARSARPTMPTSLEQFAGLIVVLLTASIGEHPDREHQVCAARYCARRSGSMLS
ncbi:hypothetical protein [Microbispora amethystogenes]|uniref:Uncharacterized protein n=1 Tax=Microbispora amethystogenes TaxID=1427754 RepID=A0ABQ4FJ07_9ACTN|nr:hypothetical protein [Microbispora amethystogenes]GIH34806.1 hypothetical protein Mam01_49700 [Microbispora amethystogenes]